jgi:hypothetical protein
LGLVLILVYAETGFMLRLMEQGGFI